MVSRCFHKAMFPLSSKDEKAAKHLFILETFATFPQNGCFERSFICLAQVSNGKWNLLNVTWLTRYYHPVTTPPTFKSTVCGGNAKQMYFWARVLYIIPKVLYRSAKWKRRFRLSVSLPSGAGCTCSLDSQKESSSPVPQLRKLGNQLSLHDPIRNIPWTVEKHRSLSYPSNSPIWLLRTAPNSVSVNNTSCNMFLSLLILVFNRIKFHTYNLQLLLNKLQQMWDKDSTLFTERYLPGGIGEECCRIAKVLPAGLRT